MQALKLLYIEDDEKQRQAFLKQAGQLAWEITAASSGEEGLERFKAENSDVILCELNMPGIDGLQVLREVSKRSPDKPFIIMTARGTVKDAVRAIKQGAYDFVLKPYDFDLLQNTIENAYNASHSEPDLAQSLQKINRELVKAMTQFSAVMDAAPNLMIIADENDQIVSLNRVAQDYLNLSSDEFLHKPLKTFADKIKDKFVDPEDFLEKFYAIDLEKHAYEWLELIDRACVLKGPVERLVVPLTASIVGKKGENLGRFWSFSDVTELQEATEFLRKVVEASPIPFIVSRLIDGRVLFANQPLANLIGVAPEDVVGRMTPDFYADPNDRKEVISRLQMDGFIKDYEVRVKRTDGTSIWMIFNFVVTQVGGETVILGGLYDINERKIAEDALKESEQKFRQLAETINEVFWMTDPKTNEMLYISPRLKDLVGIDPQDLCGNFEDVISCIHPDDRARVRAAMSKQITGQYDEEYRFVKPDGSIRWIREKAFPIRNDAGEVYRICGVSEDYTNRKEAEEALKWERNFVSAVLDTAGALVVVLDREGRIIRFNRACETTSGYRFEEVQGKQFGDLLLTADEKEMVGQRFEQLLNTGHVSKGENCWLRKDGQKRLISWSNTTLKDDDGKVEYIVATGIDITESREVEENLKLYKKVFMHSNDSFAVMDYKGRIVTANPAQLSYFGLTEKEAIGSDIHQYVKEIDHETIVEAFHDFGKFRGEFEEETSDGQKYFIDMSIFPMFNDNDEITHFVAIGRDITEAKAVQSVLATRLRYEEGLAALSQDLLNQDSIDEDMQQALSHLLKAADVGRVYFFENFEDETFGLCMRQRYEVCAPGIKPEINNPLLQNLPYRSVFELWEEELSQGKPYYSLTKDMPDAQKMIMEDQDILSIIVLPVFVDGKWHGFIGFDDLEMERQWTKEEIRLLRTAAEMIGGYLSRRVAEDLLRVSEERFRSLVENANDIIYSFDLNGHFTYLSPKFEELTGFKTEEFLGRQHTDLIDEGDIEGYEEWIKEASDGEFSRKGFEFKSRDAQGNLRWFITNSSIVRDEDGNPIEVNGIAHDITELRNTLVELEAAYKTLSETQTQLIQ
ncbi:PAS domain S-box protein [bacterium]|nr:PAS domain S-box protein [bacterium]